MVPNEDEDNIDEFTFGLPRHIAYYIYNVLHCFFPGSLKQKFPKCFQDMCLYSEVCYLMSRYSYRLNCRRFIQELFQDFDYAHVSLYFPMTLNCVSELIMHMWVFISLLTQYCVSELIMHMWVFISLWHNTASVLIMHTWVFISLWHNTASVSWLCTCESLFPYDTILRQCWLCTRESLFPYDTILHQWANNAHVSLYFRMTQNCVSELIMDMWVFISQWHKTASVSW